MDPPKKKTKASARRRGCKKTRPAAMYRRKQLMRFVRFIMRVLRRIRRRHGLALDDVAARAGVSRHALSKGERGKCDPLLSTVVGVVESLNVSLGEFAMAVDAWKMKHFRRSEVG